MKKVLIITTVGFNFHGITSVIYNYTNAMNKTQLQLDFLTFGDMNPSLRDKFEKIGRIIFVSHRKKNVLAYIKDLKRVLKQGAYDVVHINGNSGTMFLEVLVSKICRVDKVIVHGHSISTSHPIANWLLRVPMNIMSDVRIACSKEAGNWLYGLFRYTILNNAIDLSRFQYNTESRDECRKELGLNSQFLVGHVGHFSEAKNHPFLIDIFSKFHKLHPDSALVLLSDGPSFENVKQKVSDLGLSDAVHFLGRRADVHRWYQAMDLFLLPSLWEGLGMVLIEAQASGLQCIASEHVPAEAQITDSMQRIPLSEEDKWIGEMERAVQMSKELSRIEVSKNNQLLVEECGYRIEVEAGKLLDLYMVD